MSTFAKFPFYGEPWLDCPICGESFPRHMMQRHYKKGFLVDKLCADARAHDDYMAELIRGRERPDPSEQVVANQDQNLTLIPSGTILAPAGVGATIKVDGSNNAGFVTITAGSSGILVNHTIFSVNFGTLYSSVPKISFLPWDPNAIAFKVAPSNAVAFGVYVSLINQGGFFVALNAIALQALVTYSWTYGAHV